MKVLTSTANSTKLSVCNHGLGFVYMNAGVSLAGAEKPTMGPIED